MNDCARGQEEQCFEVGVGGEVEDSRGIVMDALAHEHIAKLTDGRIGQDAFDVKLDHCNCCGEIGGSTAHETPEIEGPASNSTTATWSCPPSTTRTNPSCPRCAPPETRPALPR